MSWSYAEVLALPEGVYEEAVAFVNEELHKRDDG